jgi:hypothetical protein
MTDEQDALKRIRAGNILGSSRAEQDTLLDRVFVSTSEFRSLTHSTDFNVVVGRRGTGKSALFRKVHEYYGHEPGVLSVSDAVEEHTSLSISHRLGGVCEAYEHARAIMRIVWKVSILSHAAIELFKG